MGQTGFQQQGRDILAGGGQQAGDDAAAVFVIGDIHQGHALAIAQNAGDEIGGAAGHLPFVIAMGMDFRRIDPRQTHIGFHFLPQPDAGAHPDRVAIDHMDHMAGNRAGNGVVHRIARPCGGPQNQQK